MDSFFVSLRSSAPPPSRSAFASSSSPLSRRCCRRKPPGGEKGFLSSLRSRSSLSDLTFGERREREKEREKETFVSVSKNAFFFHFLFTFSRAHMRAFARAYNITFFLRARAHAREKVTRIAIIDKSLSMIVGGRVGALFFIVCFLSVLEIQIDFCISPPAWQMNE
jgi:hypothetical protein